MNEVIPFLSQAQTQLPANVAAAFGDEANITSGKAPPKLSYKGKLWRIKIDGNETPLMRKNAEGEDEPIPVMRVVILDVNPNRSRALFEGDYDAGKESAPVCWASDGKTPDDDVPEPFADSCATCPNSVKGSKIKSTGEPTVACPMFRNIAVVPSKDLAFQPLQLRLAITSIYDAENKDQEAKGWFAFDQYLQFLRSRHVLHTAAVVTKIKFDPNPNIAYPKLLFSADNWVEDAAAVKRLIDEKRTELDTLCAIKTERVALPAGSPPATLAAPVADAAPAGAPPATTRTRRTRAAAAAAPAAAPAAPTAPPAMVVDPDTGDPVPAARTAPQQTAAPVVSTPAPAAAAAPAAPPTAAPEVATPGQVPSSVASLLANWDD